MKFSAVIMWSWRLGFGTSYSIVPLFTYPDATQQVGSEFDLTVKFFEKKSRKYHLLSFEQKYLNGKSKAKYASNNSYQRENVHKKLPE